MIIEEWLRWEPITGLASKYYIDAISDSSKGINILFSESGDIKSTLKVVFKTSAQAYRITDESYCISMASDLYEKYGREFYTQ